MSLYAKVKNGNVFMFPYTIADLTTENPNTNFVVSNDLSILYSVTEDAKSTGCEVVQVQIDSAFGYIDPRKKVVKGTVPIKINDAWVLKDSVVDKTAEELAAHSAVLAQEAEDKINANLAASEWTQLPDSNLTHDVVELWATYRADLQSVPSQSGFPWDINWPKVP
jgi:hypothetical protein